MYDERLGKTHWSVPGHDDFDMGICFPKDMKAFIKLFDELNVDTNILKAADKTNDEVRLNKDWESMKGRLSMRITIVAGARPNFMKIAPIIRDRKTSNRDNYF